MCGPFACPGEASGSGTRVGRVKGFTEGSRRQAPTAGPAAHPQPHQTQEARMLLAALWMVALLGAAVTLLILANGNPLHL
jgi:hypothetical protein